MKTFIERQKPVARNVRRVIRMLTIPMMALCTIVVVNAQSPDRSQPPQLGPTPSLKVNPVQKFTLDNGLPIYVYEKKEVPIIQLNLVIQAGSVNEPADKLGMAGLTAAMMDEGAAGKSSLQLSDEIDYLGTSLSVSGGLHTSGIAMRSTVSKFDESLKLFSDILLRPDFPESELNRLKKQYMTSLFQAFDRPTAIAAAAAGMLVFGKDHQYGRTTVGTEQSLQSLSVTDLRNFYSMYYKPNNAILVVVGDVNAQEVVSKINKAIGAWQRGDSQAMTVPNARQVSGRTIYLVDKPEAAQSVIRISKVGTNRFSQDYFPLLVMNTILGGSFTSRLNQNLREKNGYAYGAGSGFGFRPSNGPFTAASDVQTDATDKALREFIKELDGMTNPVSDDELSKAKNYIALGYPDNFSNVGSIAAQIAEMVQYHLPDSYFNDYIANVMAVKKEDVRRVARKYLDTDDLAIIIVGDRSKVEKGLKATKIGKIVNMVPTDILGPMPKL